MITEFFNGLIELLQYSVTNGFLHFVGCCVVICATARFMAIFRVNIANKTKAKKKEE